MKNVLLLIVLINHYYHLYKNHLFYNNLFYNNLFYNNLFLFIFIFISMCINFQK